MAICFTGMGIMFGVSTGQSCTIYVWAGGWCPGISSGGLTFYETHVFAWRPFWDSDSSFGEFIPPECKHSCWWTSCIFQCTTCNTGCSIEQQTPICSLPKQGQAVCKECVGNMCNRIFTLAAFFCRYIMIARMSLIMAIIKDLISESPMIGLNG